MQKIIDVHYVVKMQGKLAGQVIGCTGNGPYPEDEIEKLIYYGLGTIGRNYIWQNNQIIVVGRVDYSKPYLKHSLEIGKRLNFTCRYMSQEDFCNRYLKDDIVQYYLNDPRIKQHEGLSYIDSLNTNWHLQIPVSKVKWQILPPGDHPFHTVLGHYRQLQEMTDTRIKIDEQRLATIYELQPTKIYVGIDDFERYIVFHFPQFGKVVFECPIEGNAIYVIDDGGWEALSQYSKAELLDFFRNQVQRVIHKGDWRLRLEKTLEPTYC